MTPFSVIPQHELECMTAGASALLFAPLLETGRIVDDGGGGDDKQIQHAFTSSFSSLSFLPSFFPSWEFLRGFLTEINLPTPGLLVALLSRPGHFIFTLTSSSSWATSSMRISHTKKILCTARGVYISPFQSRRGFTTMG